MTAITLTVSKSMLCTVVHICFHGIELGKSGTLTVVFSSTMTPVEHSVRLLNTLYITGVQFVAGVSMFLKRHMEPALGSTQPFCWWVLRCFPDGKLPGE
jgi:hypothetical protein